MSLLMPKRKKKVRVKKGKVRRKKKSAKSELEGNQACVVYTRQGRLKSTIGDG